MGEKARKNFVKRMITGLILGVVFGVIASLAKTSMAPDTWNIINMIFFQDITVSAGRSALGLFYIVQTVFTNALKLAIVPMVFFSIIMSVCSMNDMRKLGRIAGKTIVTFVLFYLVACVFAAIVSELVIGMGVYRPFQVDQAAASVTARNTATTADTERIAASFRRSTLYPHPRKADTAAAMQTIGYSFSSPSSSLSMSMAQKNWSSMYAPRAMAPPIRLSFTIPFGRDMAGFDINRTSRTLILVTPVYCAEGPVIRSLGYLLSLSEPSSMAGFSSSAFFPFLPAGGLLSLLEMDHFFSSIRTRSSLVSMTIVSSPTMTILPTMPPMVVI